MPIELVNATFNNLVVESVDEYRFKIKNFNSYTFTDIVDCSKFYFEVGSWDNIKLTNLNLSSCRNVKIKVFGQMGDFYSKPFEDGITPHIYSGDVSSFIPITLKVNMNSYIQNYMYGEVMVNIRENDTVISQLCYNNYFQKGFYSIHGDYMKNSTPIFRFNTIPKGYSEGVRFTDDMQFILPSNPTNVYLNGMTIEIYDMGEI